MSDTPSPQRKPRDDEIDVYALTHAGKVREGNEDHFLVCQLRKQIQVHLTSLPDPENLGGEAERLAFLAMMADGVGGRGAGEAASRRTIAAVTRYVSESIGAYYTAVSSDHEAFTGALYVAALRVHEELLAAGEADPSMAGMATTLTLWIGVWPHIYLLQVGDSRHYVFREGRLFRSHAIRPWARFSWIRSSSPTRRPTASRWARSSRARSAARRARRPCRMR